MSLLLGIDLGTSSVKCLLAAADGSTVTAAEREYPLLTPRQDWAEQDPEMWWQRTAEAVRAVLAQTGVQPEDVKAVGLSGQMHGTVLLDTRRRPLRPAIIWADQRSAAQCQQIHERIGYERIARIAGSGVFPGFMLATLLWVQQHEPEIWTQVDRVLFPKDYVRLRLTGEAAMDVTDASGGLLLDVQRRDWAHALFDAFAVPLDRFPRLVEAQTVVGELTAEAAAATGLAAGIPVVAGAADQATGALGSGIHAPGTVLATVGTGGQLVTVVDRPRVDEQLRVHTFCHALPRTWYLLGATLSAGLAFRWLRDNILREEQPGAYERMTAAAEGVPPGADGLLFLPYLIGERSVKESALQRALFYGLTPRHDHAHLVRATMEGVIFSMKRMLDVFGDLGVTPTQIVAAGGGARSALWRQIMADIFAAPVVPLDVQEQSALGAVILAGLGTGIYSDAGTASQIFVRYGETVEPQSSVAHMYQEQYSEFAALVAKLA